MWLRLVVAVGIISACLPTLVIDTASAKPTTGPTVTASASPSVPVRRPTVPGSVHVLSPSGTSCRMLMYSDGRKALYVCLDYADSTSSTWVARNRLAWNPSVAQGGHSDDFSGDDGFTQVQWFPNTFFCGDGTLTDTRTCTDTRNTYQNDANTQWVQVQGYAPWEPGGIYCKRVFFNHNGANAYTNQCAGA